MGGVVWLSVTSFGLRGGKIEANSLWEGTVRVIAGTSGKGRSITAAIEELGSKSEPSEPGTAGPGDPRLPWWLPDPAEGGVALELQEAIAQSILPAYQQLVLEAPSMMERVAGEMLIHALWADCLRQLNRPVIGSAMRAKRRPAVYSPPVLINGRLPARGGAESLLPVPGGMYHGGPNRLPARGGAERLLWRSGGSTVVPKRPLYFAPVSANYFIAGTPTSRAVAEESKGVDQRRPAKAGTPTPTSGTVAEESRGVDQGRRAKAGTPTPTSGTVAEESRGVNQGRRAKAGTPTSRAVAEKLRGVDQARTTASGKELLS